jgi:3-deoxy-manno-octulosonate cytidylyltransferase (CMP-KDO synthetase)
MILGIIPARYASTRFPGKPLADIAGMTMIERVYRQAVKSKSLSKVLVATDDARIISHVNNFGGEAVMTSPDHPSGTDRCYEALKKISGNFKYVINIQGDEPFIDPRQIDELAELLKDGKTELATLMMPVHSSEELFSNTTAKIVVNSKSEALYFSRQAIPFFRDKEPSEWHKYFTYYLHVGMYAYRTDVLERITKLPPSPLEKTEMLEQLRWLENGFTICCGITDIKSYPVDKPDDIPRVLETMGMI